ncbi:MAG: DUF4157 domain-containing protein [Anaerolineae bacterium]
MGDPNPALALERQKHHKSHDTARPVVADEALAQCAAPFFSLRASDAPRVYSPANLLALQHIAGNRAVTRLIQRKLMVGAANDAYEQEADRVAEQVVKDNGRRIAATGRAPVVAREAEEEEEVQTQPLVQALSEEQAAQPRRVSKADRFEAGGEFESQLRATQGGGTPLPEGVRGRMETGLRADFSRVRVHTGPSAARLNRAVSAQAFTHGQDIYLGAGASPLESGAGQRLIAHELTHVLQQTGGPVQRRVGRTPLPVVQRVGKKQETEPEPAPVRGTLTTFEAAMQYFAQLKKSRLKRGGASKSERKRLAVQYYNGEVAKATDPTVTDRDIRMAYKTTFKEELPAPEKKKLEEAHETWGGLAGVQPDYADTGLSNQAPDKYQLTLAVAQEDADWLKNIKDLRKVAYKSPRTAYKVSKTGEMGELSKKVLEKRGELEGKNETEQNEAIQTFTDGIHNVGHTWVRFSTFAGNTLQALYSFGFWPLKRYEATQQELRGGYGGPLESGPGHVRHPDVEHEEDSHKQYIDFVLTPLAYQQAFDKAQERYKSPPAYTLAGYNCTTFAREIVQTAGKSFPGSGLRVLHKRAFTPGLLYEALAKKTEAYKGDKDPLKDVVGQVTTQTQARMEQDLIRMAVVAQTRMDEQEARALQVKDLLVLYALKAFKGKGRVEIDRVTGDFVTELTLVEDKTAPIKPSFMDELSDKGRAAVAKLLGIEINALDDWLYAFKVHKGLVRFAGEDPSRYLKGIKRMRLPQALAVKAARSPEGQANVDLALAKDTDVKVIVTDEWTVNYGRCRLEVWGQSNAIYYLPLKAVLGEPQKTMTTNEAQDILIKRGMDRLAKAVSRPTRPLSLQDLRLFAQMSLIPPPNILFPQLKKLDQEGQEALACLLLITVKELQEQLKNV